MLSPRRLTLLCAIPASALSAQNQSAGPGTQLHEPPSMISSSGVADIKVTPDRATIQISVQTRGMTAAAAATDNTKKQSSVLSSLRKLGIPNERLSTTNYSVEPQYRYAQNKDPVLTGYIVTNTVVADIYDIKKIGPSIDAALSSGANIISSLDLYASNTSIARRQAIEEGIEKARGEAEAAARALGGSLGNVISIDIDAEPSSSPRPMYARAMAAGGDVGSTPINPGQQTLTVRVSTRWQFVAVRKR
jgi:uncharacterized protein YggE